MGKTPKIRDLPSVRPRFHARRKEQLVITQVPKVLDIQFGH